MGLGTIAGRFVLGEEAGKGGMGRVYRARDLVDGAEVAVKVLTATVDGAGVERFRREIELLGSLAHPNLVRYVAHAHTARRPPRGSVRRPAPARSGEPLRGS